jgi:hypothetical protein
MTQAFNLSQLANKVNSSGQLDGATGLTGTVTSSSSAVILGSTSGSVTISAPAVAGTTALTLPARSGTVMVNGPAFSATQTPSTSCGNATFTKLTYTSEEFDTASNYDAPNSAFTPTVAGYYQISASFNFSGANLGGNNSLIALYKNGSWFKSGSGGNIAYYNISALVYMNGSTDYLEIYAYQSSGGTLTTSASGVYQFAGALIRSA